MRRLLSRADILALIQESRQLAFNWIEDNKLRRDAFSKQLHSGNIAFILRMINEIHFHQQQRIDEGKKPCATDESILSEAQQLVHQEFSYVLKMSQEDTVTFIRAELEKAGTHPAPTSEKR